MLLSVTTHKFREGYANLPEAIQRTTRKAYYLWKADNAHPAAQFKLVHPNKPIYSARAGLGYRAVGIKETDTIIWFWIGPHSEYNRLLKLL